MTTAPAGASSSASRKHAGASQTSLRIGYTELTKRRTVRLEDGVSPEGPDLHGVPARRHLLRLGAASGGTTDQLARARGLIWSCRRAAATCWRVQDWPA